MEKRGACFCVFDYMCQQVHAHKCQGDELPVLSHTFSNKPTVTSCVCRHRDAALSRVDTLAKLL